MASFQVELVPSSPFFQNNLNNLDLADLWVHHPQWQTTASTSAAAGATDAQCNNNNNKKKKKKKKNKDGNNNSDDGNSTYAAYAADKPKDKWARAREIVFPANTNTSTTPPKGDDNNNNNNNNNNRNAGGVSSLVQKWRGFEAVAKRSSSSSGTAPPPLPPGPAPLSIDDDSSSSVIGDWESDRTILSGRSSIRGRDSDATESERLRVADIIRKLTPNEAGGCSVSPPRLRTSLDQCLPPPTATTTRVRTSLDHQSSDILSLRCCIAPSPRIRGRQAYLDLLSQRERDRRTDLQRLLDRKPVSKFSNRGRIQAVLKIKLLRRGIQAKEAGGHSNTINPFESYKPMQFRQRVNQKAQNGALNFEKDPAKDNNTPGPNSNSDVDHVRKQEKYQEVVVSNTKTCPRAQDDGHDCRASKHDDLLMRHNANFLHTYEEAAVTTSFIGQGTSHGLAAMSAETSSAEAPKSLDHPNEDDKATATNYDLMTHDDCALPTYGGDSILETSAYWVADFSNPEDGWEELQSDYQTKEANNIDWIDQVSRPRSDWEYLRQERYQEMLDPFLDNEEIRVLLGRKSVSNFLSSGMREKIDKLMISRSQVQVHLNNNQTQNKRGGQLGQVLKKEGEGEGEEEEYGEYFDEYEEAESSVGQQFTECDEYVDTSTPQSQNPNQNGNQNQGHVPSECSYQAASPSTQQSSTNYCSQDMTGRNSSYSTHPTFEMEIIYDLRRHMEQLHQEIAELRKSIKCCTDMQIKLHRSIKKEVSVALTHPDAKNGRRHPAKKGTSGSRRCCVCCKLQVDCLLYRCGHMCTCFDCANELHWSSGTCPICRAQILDVVRTQYSNS